MNSLSVSFLCFFFSFPFLFIHNKKISFFFSFLFLVLVLFQVLSDFNSDSCKSCTRWNDVGRRLALRRTEKETEAENHVETTGHGRETDPTTRWTKWEEVVVVSYRSRPQSTIKFSEGETPLSPLTSLGGEHEVLFLKDGRLEFVNLEERRYVWIDGVAASPLDSSDMPVILRVGDRCKARWKGGSRTYPEHYVATVTALTMTGANLKFSRKVLGEGVNVPFNDIQECRAVLTTEVLTKLKQGDLISARWRHGTHWPGWYGARVVGVFLKRGTNDLYVRVSYDKDREDGAGDHRDDVPMRDCQVPMLFQ